MEELGSLYMIGEITIMIMQKIIKLTNDKGQVWTCPLSFKLIINTDLKLLLKIKFTKKFILSNIKLYRKLLSISNNFLLKKIKNVIYY